MSRFLEKQNGNKNDEQDDGAQIRACTQESAAVSHKAAAPKRKQAKAPGK